MDKRSAGKSTEVVPNKRMARAFGKDVCKTVQEILHFQEHQEVPAMVDLPTSVQLEHLEEMETASRSVFERRKKALWDAQVEARDAHLKHMCTKAPLGCCNSG